MFNKFYTSQELMSNYFVFGIVREEDNAVVYIGYSLLRNFFTFRTLINNPIWREYIGERKFTIILLSNHTAEQNARIEMRNAIGQYKPIINMDKRFYLNQGRVTCNETGTIYRNASEACLALGLPTSAMSNHLNGKPGHRTIKGLTFRRGL